MGTRDLNCEISPLSGSFPVLMIFWNLLGNNSQGLKACAFTPGWCWILSLLLQFWVPGTCCHTPPYSVSLSVVNLGPAPQGCHLIHILHQGSPVLLCIYFKIVFTKPTTPNQFHSTLLCCKLPVYFWSWKNILYSVERSLLCEEEWKLCFSADIHK